MMLKPNDIRLFSLTRELVNSNGFHIYQLQALWINVNLFYKKLMNKKKYETIKFYIISVCSAM